MLSYLKTRVQCTAQQAKQVDEIINSRLDSTQYKQNHQQLQVALSRVQFMLRGRSGWAKHFYDKQSSTQKEGFQPS